MNKVLLVGRLTRDPELRSINTGSSVCNFSIAINRPFKNKEGTIDADFINIIVFGRNAENLAKYCAKGSQVAVDGRLQTRNYVAQDGTKRYVTEVIADNVEFLGSKKDRIESNTDVIANIPSATSVTTIDEVPKDEGIDVSATDQFEDFGNEISISEDDLPF